MGVVPEYWRTAADVINTIHMKHLRRNKYDSLVEEIVEAVLADWV
jgi:hypothetical protein